MMAGSLSEVSPTRNADGFLRGTACIAALVTALVAAVPVGLKAEDGHSPSNDVRIVAAWETLRAVECARCHGKDYDGLAAPSIIEYARTQNREMFVRLVLDGDAARGMPSYRHNPRVLETIDDIYRYFLGRAEGSIGKGRPAATQ
jgi:mono/diheme cytochrome c family protein